MSEDIAQGFLYPHIPGETTEFLKLHKRAFNNALKNAEVIDSTESDPIFEKSKIIIGLIGMGSGPGSGLIRSMVIQVQEREVFIIREKNIIQSPTLPDCSGIGRSIDYLMGTFKLSAEEVEKLRDSFTYAKSKKKRTKNNRKHSKRR